MLLMQDPVLLLLDEPVAGMTDEETKRTAELFLSAQILLRQLADQVFPCRWPQLHVGWLYRALRR